MKRVWAALLMTALALLAAAAEYLYIGAGTQVYIDMLNEADALMEQNETAAACELAERADTRFCNQSRIYDIFMFHSDVNEISASLASLRRYAQTGDASEFLAASAKIKRLMMSMTNALTPRAENIM